MFKRLLINQRVWTTRTLLMVGLMAGLIWPALSHFRGLRPDGCASRAGRETLVLSESGDEFTTDAYTIVYSVDGIPGTPSCSNSVGTRFKLEP